MLLLSLPATILNCSRGLPSDKRPIHIIRDMSNQPRYNPQGESDFFEDGSTMRTPVPGTVAQGFLEADSAYFRGLDRQGNFIKMAPVHVTLQLLQRGRERFNIFCSPCHGRLGDGNGIIVQRGYIPPPSFHTNRVRNFPDGQIFDAISNGVRNMPSYNAQIPIADRWAIVSYLRALQRSQNATIEDVPEELRDKIK
jgi:hypothetical protein